MKKCIKFLTISLCLLVTLTGCSNNKEKDEKLVEEKLNSEISFLDNELQRILNQINGISYESYKVTTDEVKQTELQSSGSEEKSSGESSGSGESSQGEGQSGGESSQSSEGSSDSSSKNNAKIYNMTSNSILTNERQTNWDEIKEEIETFYASWTTMSVDLYKIKVNAQDILNFSSDLDLATQSIKNEDKENSLINIAKLYSYIPTFYGTYGGNETNLNIYKTKSEIINAYSIVETRSNEEIYACLQRAEQNFDNIVNNTENTNKQMSINKTYVLINELQNTISTRDLDIFYIKYKNLVQEIDKILVG